MHANLTERKHAPGREILVLISGSFCLPAAISNGPAICTSDCPSIQMVAPVQSFRKVSIGLPPVVLRKCIHREMQPAKKWMEKCNAELELASWVSVHFANASLSWVFNCVACSSRWDDEEASSSSSLPFPPFCWLVFTSSPANWSCCREGG